MNKIRFNADIDSLAHDICKEMDASLAQKDIVIAAINDILIGSKNVSEKVDCIIATGDILRSFVCDCEKYLKIILEENNEKAHQEVMDSLNRYFGKYGSASYQERLKLSCSGQAPDSWKKHSIDIRPEPLISWILNAYSKLLASKKNQPQKSVNQLYSVGKILFNFSV